MITEKDLRLTQLTSKLGAGFILTVEERKFMAEQIVELFADKSRLDQMEAVALTNAYGNGWIFRPSGTGRGWRLHTSSGGVSWNIRKAIDAGLAAL